MRRLSFLLFMAAMLPLPLWAGDFPSLVADDLNGRELNLPQDLPGNPTIVFIAYKRDQQPIIDAWVKAVGLDESPDPAWVELPVVGQGARLFRPIVDNGMRSGITSKAMRARTITIYSNRSRFNKAMGIKSMDTIYVAVVTKTGQIKTLIQGPVSEQKLAQLQKSLGEK